MTHKITGVIIKIFDLVHVTDNYSKREFVLQTDEKYPQKIQFQTGNKNIEQLNAVTEGEEVTVEFNLRGREWENKEGEVKYFNSLDAWRITSENAQSVQHNETPSKPEPIVNEDNEESDLPF